LLKAGLKEGMVSQETEAEVIVTKEEPASKSISLSSATDSNAQPTTNELKIPDFNDISDEVEQDLAPPTHKQATRITTKEISSSEAQYFSKFGLIPPNPNPYDKSKP